MMARENIPEFVCDQNTAFRALRMELPPPSVSSHANHPISGVGGGLNPPPMLFAARGGFCTVMGRSIIM